MANIALDTADRVEVVESILQLTLPSAEDIDAGAPIRVVPSSTGAGKFTNANATTTAEARVYGIATKSVLAGMPVTGIRIGVMDGFDLSGLNYDADLYLSDTDGRINDTAGTIDARLGRVIPATANLRGTSLDKLLFIDCREAEDSTLDSLAVGTADALTVNSEIVPTRLDVTAKCLLNADCIDQAFFVANRAYRVVAVREVHATAGDDGGAVNAQVTKDTSTEAPGAGANLLTNNANAGFNMKGTANTVQSGTLTATTADLALAAGDRLSLDFAGTATTLAGVVVTVSLRPI